MSKKKQFTIEEKANVVFRLKKVEKNSDVANESGSGHSQFLTYGKLQKD